MNVKTVIALVTIGLISMLGAGCDSRESKKQQDVPKLRPECDSAATECHRGCFKRQEGGGCGSCCFGQMILCNEGNKYSFESCEGTDPDTRTR
jgi:hypothetical protein